MVAGFVFYHDPEHDLTYRGAMSSSLKVYSGEIGFIEFAGKVMQVAHAILHDDGTLIWQKGSLWRFDEVGLVDQEYVMATQQAVINKAMSGNPYHSAKSAEWKMQMRRADANSSMMEWGKNPALRKRLDDYILRGKKHPKIKTTRSLTNVSNQGGKEG